jgi:hypothetical protein
MALMVDEILTALGTRITSKLKEDIEKKRVTKYGAVNASGALRDSVRFEVEKGVLRVYALDYSFYLEKGRKPGKFPPREPIINWIKSKGLSFDIPINSLAFLIQRKIAQKGTTIFEQGGSDLFSGVINEQMIEGLKSDLFEALIDEAVSSFHSNVLKMAA